MRRLWFLLFSFVLFSPLWAYELTADDYDIIRHADHKLVDYVTDHSSSTFDDMSVMVGNILLQDDLSVRTRAILSYLADSLRGRTATNITTTETVQYASIAGVDADLLSMDISWIDDGRRYKPVLMRVHGGSRYLGDKAGKNIEHKRDFALRNGWVFVSVNYRLSPQPPLSLRRLDPDRIQYPDHSNDLADAIAWVYHYIDQYGGDSESIGLIGHSAGAHLVSLAGTRREFLVERGVPFEVLRAIASIDIDVYDVRDYIDAGIPMIINAFGDNAELNDQASPLYNIYAGEPYPDFFVAKRGSDERMERIDEFIVALARAGVFVVDQQYTNYTHIEIGDAIGVDDSLTPDLQEFFVDSFEG